MALVSNCLKCGAPLPEVGDCSRCHSPAHSVAPKVPPLFEQELQGRLPPTLPKLPSVPARASSPPVPDAEQDEADAATRVFSVPKWVGQAAPIPQPKPEHPFESDAEPESELDAEPDLGHEPTQILALPKPFASIPQQPITPKAAPSSGYDAEEPQPSSTVPPHREPRPGELYASIAPVWRRLVAGTIDFGAICAVAGLYLTLALAITGKKAPATTLTGIDGWMITLHGWQPVVGSGLVLTALLAAAYSVAFTVIWDGQTPGRRLMGLKLVDLSGSAPPPALAMKRALLCWISALLFLAGYWLMLFDRRRQSLHDKLTKTFIVIPGFPSA
jgi:uncharacterized RDD family membrane protein YckC